MPTFKIDGYEIEISDSHNLLVKNFPYSDGYGNDFCDLAVTITNYPHVKMHAYWTGNNGEEIEESPVTVDELNKIQINLMCKVLVFHNSIVKHYNPSQAKIAKLLGMKFIT